MTEPDNDDKNSLTILPEGGRVVIIGGGPGGTACALALDRLAAETGRRLQITVLESKHFSEEQHYNQCAGVLSPPLPALLEERLGIPFPRQLCLVEIDGYVLHSAEEQIQLVGEKDGSIAVRRVEFDAHMLEQVKQRGISVWPLRATDIEFWPDHVMVYTENEPIEADVVVGAFGLDEGSASMFSRMTQYRPPKSIDSIVTKFQPDEASPDNFGSNIHAFLPRHPRIEFGAVTPKCSHLTINIAGTTVDSLLMDAFLKNPTVQAVVPFAENDLPSKNPHLLYHKGRFPRSLARGFYGDRYVMIGDAAGLVRAFKGKGATTAVMTGIRAADVIMNNGISEQAFDDHYRTANRDIIDDLPYGKFMRLVTISISRLGLLDMVLRAAKRSPDLRSALYEAVSGHGTYREIIGKSLRPNTVRAVLRAMFSSET